MGQSDGGNRRKLQRMKAAAIVFLATTGLVCLVNLVSQDKEFSEKENRVLEQKPKFTLGAVESGRFMKQYESYKSDQFAGRDFWVSLKTRVDLIAGKRKANGVFKGSDNYLLEDISVMNEEQVKKNTDAIRAFAEEYPELPVYMMLVPNAANVLQDKLPLFAVTEDQDAQFAKIQKDLGDSVHWIDVSKTMKKHKNEEIYYHTDHHWTTLGASYAYETLVKNMKLDPSKVPAFKPYAVANDFNGTLSSTSGYEAGYEEPIYIYAPKKDKDAVEVVVNYVDEQKKTATLYDRSKLKGKDKYGMFLGGNYSMLDIRTTADTTARLLLFKDSYANAVIPFLTPYYREIIVIDPRYYYGDITEVMQNHKITDILFLYNGNTFVEDNSISGVLQNGETE